MDEGIGMGRVMIVDADAAHVAAMEEALLAINCKVAVCAELSAAVETLRTEPIDVVVMVHSSRAQWKKDVDSLCRAVRELEEQPHVLCVLRGPYRGPSDRLYGDQLNVQVLHEEQ